MLAPIRLTNAGSCPSRQRDCVAEPIRLANAAAPLLLRSQARRKAYRARSAETQGTAQLPCGSGETQGDASPLHSAPTRLIERVANRSDEVQGKMSLNRKSPRLPVTYLEVLYVHPLVPRAGIEPATPAFSVLCSTD